MRRTLVLVAMVAVLICAGAAVAQETQPAAQERFCGLCDAKHKMHELAPWLTLGADARLREVFAPNLLLDREDRHFQRYRFRTWATVTPVEDLDFNIRLVYEPRHFCQPARQAYTRDAKTLDDWTLSEAVFDQLNVTWKKALGLPLTVTVGRQDIILGDGWLVIDGTPLDGSRTIFFDAVRATYQAADIQTTFDAIFICQKADSDWWLRPFCDKDFHNMEQDELGVILYVTNKSLPDTQIDGYFIYKHDNADLGTEPGDVRSGGLAQWQCGTDAEIYTVGLRVAHTINDNWKCRAEIAQQMGNKNGDRLCALGFNSRLTYLFRDDWNTQCHVGYEYLSGDKNSSGKNEQFDPLWGRWPQWSELYIYGAALENRPSEITNHHRVNVGCSCEPMKDLSLSANYNLVFADKNSFSDRAYFTESGCLKGQSIAGLVKYRFNEHVSTHVYAEVFFPGDYYSKLRNETAGFFRWEILFSW